MGKLTATDTDGFSLEELEDSEAEEGEEGQRREGSQDCTEKQVILKIVLRSIVGFCASKSPESFK